MSLHYDNLDTLDGEALIVEATITLLPAEEGGLPGPVVPQFRPNHNFEGPENRYMYIGQVYIPKGGEVYPSQPRDLFVIFLNVKGLREKLEVGRQWRLQAGPRLLGLAIVKRLVTEEEFYGVLSS